MNITNYRAKDVICQKDGDGGDSAQRTGSFYTLLALLESKTDDRGLPLTQGAELDFMSLSYGQGRYRRNGDGHQSNGRWFRWYANPNNFTADQSILLQTAFLTLKNKKRLKDLYDQRRKRCFFHFNTESYDDGENVRRTIPDMPRPIEFSIFMRGLSGWWSYPLLCIFDFQLITDLIFRNLGSRGKYDSDVTYLPVLLSCVNTRPTPWGILAKFLYKKTDAIVRIKEYFSEANGKNGIEPLGRLYETVWNRLIK